ncbi:MAG TPA: hypothetical protein VFD32_20425, partial [Dehalococcoidia bacterium]|nr:hypothetical protein [Dehalococcoidia bacterium]
MAPVEFHIAIGAHQQQRQRGQLAGDELQQRQRGGVRPVQVFEHEQQWPPAGRGAQPAQHRVEQAKARLFRIDRGRRGKAGQEPRQLWQQRQQIRGARAEVGGKLIR